LDPYSIKSQREKTDLRDVIVFHFFALSCGSSLLLLLLLFFALGSKDPGLNTKIKSNTGMATHAGISTEGVKVSLKVIELKR
jgi:hypothetical protein